MSAIVGCHPHPNPHQTPPQPGHASSAQPGTTQNRREEANTTRPSPPTRKTGTLHTHKEPGEGVGESPERVADQDWVMIGFTTHPATPTRIDTGTS